MDGELEGILAEVRKLSAQEREHLKARLRASLRQAEAADILATQEICVAEIVRAQTASRGTDENYDGTERALGGR